MIPLPVQDPTASEPDWGALGLVLVLGGTFLLGNALLFRNPRDLVAERFGVRGARLVAIRELIFQRVQVALGFADLLAGFGLQLLGRYRPEPSGAASEFPGFWVAAIVLATVALLALGWVWSSHAFRRYVRERAHAAPPDLEADPVLAREIGELFGVEARPEDSVASYAERVRRALGLPPAPRPSPREITLPGGGDLGETAG